VSKKPTPFHSGQFQSFDGTSIHYEVRGEGEPIVFIYGLACLINHWHFQIEHFSHTHKAIAFDIRGHHKSDIPDDPQNLSLEAVARDIPYLFRELGIKKAHFAGHSLGAQTILKTYELSPELFKSITFINGFAKNPIKGMFGLDVIEPFFRFAQNLYQKNPALLDTIWKRVIENPLSILGAGVAGGFNLRVTQLKDIEIYARGVAQTPLKVFLPFFENMMTFEGDQVATQIQVPTLIISGDKDMVTPQNFQEELHRLISGSEFVRVPYGSHCTQLDFPDYINLKMDQFYSKIERPRKP
jgi:pimeloyl-ACP methyl ester carboxylesterase